MGDTPRDAKVHLPLSKVFDVYAEAYRASFKKLGKKAVRQETSWTLRNAKTSPVSVRVVQPIYGQWKLLSGSHKGVKVSPSEMQWTVMVPGSGEVKVEAAFELAR